MRVPRTFVFVDISGFTNFTNENGDDAAGRLLASWRAVTRDVASETGVRIAKWLGDGCMIVAVDQRDAITFALELQKRSGAACAPLSIRVGMASGLALLFEGDDYIGTAVNMAARLCDACTIARVLTGRRAPVAVWTATPPPVGCVQRNDRIAAGDVG